MARFILRYSGAAAPPEHARVVAGTPNIKVIDSSPKMMLIEADEEEAKQLPGRLPGWNLYPEVHYKIPDTRKRITNDTE